MTAPDRMRGLRGRLVLDARDYARDRRRWLAARRAGLGASETAAVLGLNSWRTPLEVWLDKTGDGPVDDTPPSVAAMIGTDLEDQVARWTVRAWPDLGKIGPTPGLLAHEEHPWMLATLDRLLYPRGTTSADPLGILEVKTTTRWNYERHWIDGVPPEFVQVQVQQQLAVTGLDTAWVACWVRDDRAEAALKVPYRIDADPAVHDQIATYAGQWWRRHVLGNHRPPVTVTDGPALDGLHVPNLDADPVPADAELEAIVADWLHAKARAKDVAADVKAAEAAMKAAMVDSGANSIARPDGQLLVTWKRNRDSERLDAKAMAADHPDLAAKYTTTIPGALVLRAVKGHDE